ncbi:MAG TPA: hypothetical protein VK446_06725 [Methylocystis sp.]|nr:hypothetical protein [Methylocystis sp.]
MTTPQHKDTHRHPVRGDQESAARSRTRERKGKEVCKECRVDNAFQAWHDQTLTPSFNWLIDFADWGIIKPGTRAVIELVTATITVPAGEWARLRLYTSLGTTPSNLDLFLNPQGLVGGSQIYVATHSLRVYSDEDISFNVNRDNATTSGEAFICISGYLIDV